MATTTKFISRSHDNEHRLTTRTKRSLKEIEKGKNADITNWVELMGKSALKKSYKITSYISRQVKEEL